MERGSTNEDSDYVMLDDTNIVAYLHCRGHDFKMTVNEEGRVMFIIFGASGVVDREIKEYYGGGKVNIGHFIKSLKYVKGSLYSMKNKTTTITTKEKEKGL